MQTSKSSHPEASIRQFLEIFEKAIFHRDFDSAKPFFSSDVVSYGTRTELNLGLDQLMENQWSRIWGNCLDWKITSIDSVSESENMAMVAYRWLRINTDSTETRGRATLVFEIRDGLKVIHSHFSEMNSQVT